MMLFRIIFGLFLIECTGCVNGTDMVDILPVHKDSYDIDKRIVGTKNNQQLFFRLNNEYPSHDVVNYYNKYFKEQSWKKCINKNSEWDSYVDTTVNPERVIHQLIRFWVKIDENKMSTLTIRYYSILGKKSAHPDNSTQNVFILIQNNLDDLMNKLPTPSINCN